MNPNDWEHVAPATFLSIAQNPDACNDVRDLRAVSAWLIADYDHTASRALECTTLAARHLGLYCDSKALAVERRLEGNIPAALSYERNCELVYAQLPEHILW